MLTFLISIKRQLIHLICIYTIFYSISYSFCAKAIELKKEEENTFKFGVGLNPIGMRFMNINPAKNVREHFLKALKEKLSVNDFNLFKKKFETEQISYQNADLIDTSYLSPIEGFFEFKPIPLLGVRISVGMFFNSITMQIEDDMYQKKKLSATYNYIKPGIRFYFGKLLMPNADNNELSLNLDFYLGKLFRGAVYGATKDYNLSYEINKQEQEKQILNRKYFSGTIGINYELLNGIELGVHFNYTFTKIIQDNKKFSRKIFAPKTKEKKNVHNLSTLIESISAQLNNSETLTEEILESYYKNYDKEFEQSASKLDKFKFNNFMLYIGWNFIR